MRMIYKMAWKLLSHLYICDARECEFLDTPKIDDIIFSIAEMMLENRTGWMRRGIIENPTTRREYYIFEAQLMNVPDRKLYSVLSW